MIVVNYEFDYELGEYVELIDCKKAFEDGKCYKARVLAVIKDLNGSTAYKVAWCDGHTQNAGFFSAAQIRKHVPQEPSGDAS